MSRKNATRGQFVLVRLALASCITVTACACLHAQSISSGQSAGVFGIEARGSRFVYVFDKSGSTEGLPLQAAKTELLRSLSKLNEVQQFQIVFYNERPQVFNSGGNPRLYWADDEHRQAARRFIQRIAAGGGTDHLSALSFGLKMNPEALFFYTDADEPQMSESDLARVRRLNRSAVIHVVEFGRGPQLEDNSKNFLKRLAQENGGDYRYLDLKRWKSNQVER